MKSQSKFWAKCPKDTLKMMGAQDQKQVQRGATETNPESTLTVRRSLSLASLHQRRMRPPLWFSLALQKLSASPWQGALSMPLFLHAMRINAQTNPTFFFGDKHDEGELVLTVSDLDWTLCFAFNRHRSRKDLQRHGLGPQGLSEWLHGI